MKKMMVALCFLAALLTLFSCTKTETTEDLPSLPAESPSSTEEEEEAVFIEEILPSFEQIRFYEGEKLTLSFEISPAQPDDPTVLITAADEQIVALEDGVLTALKAGQTKLLFASRDGNCQREVDVTVLPYFAVDQIVCEIETLTLDVGDSIAPVFTVLPENATRPALTFRSSAPEIFSVSKEGRIKALAVGQGTLTVSTADEKELTVSVTVVPHENHRMGEWEIAFPASCTELGMRIRYCEICGSEKYEYEGIEILPHTYGDMEIVRPATRENNGLGQQTCGVCGDKKDTVLRVEEGVAAVGTLGPDIEFAFYEDGELYVRGEGQFYAWSTERINPLSALSGVKKVVVGEGVTLISDYSFEGFEELTEVKLPDSLQMIGTRAFFGCDKMTLTKKEMPKSLKFVGGAAFSGCKSITAMLFDDAFIGCGQSAFEGCAALETVSLPAGVSSLGSRAFAECGRLSQIHFASGTALTELPSELFVNCKSLGAAVLPEGVKTIGAAVFSGCTNLNSVSIGSALESIGKDAFKGCGGLKTVSYPESKDYFDAHVIVASGNESAKACISYGK
ncbi:MAG: leucine-rich repeat protein [Clostridia bacterium]|nr:leucine-rich repeat protein [Clostridia bacterium]